MYFFILFWIVNSIPPQRFGFVGCCLKAAHGWLCIKQGKFVPSSCMYDSKLERTSLTCKLVWKWQNVKNFKKRDSFHNFTLNNSLKDGLHLYNLLKSPVNHYLNSNLFIIPKTLNSNASIISLTRCRIAVQLMGPT